MMIAFATEPCEAASEVRIVWGNNEMRLEFPEPILTFAEITEAVRKRFPGIKPLGQYLSKGVCRVVFREEDFDPYGEAKK